ncbi:hypothetical protein [Actibacterium pelagium]|uniref:Uncharacterized protein n=1 Tax=Actibacterium pelagium TaxID=2029103 RepID=A0A917ABF5_9RHOB|nr:hypothetical protein [Actibacterium pelagium]GGE40222.1 hypothetical protein GCM10011517_04940 [Actibacterium pelagium]
MRRFFLGVLFAMTSTAPVFADPDFGPREDLFDFKDYEWLDTGAMFCLDGECDDGAGLNIYYLVADAEVSRLQVIVLFEADSLLDTGTRGIDDCMLPIEFLNGRLYGSPEALVYTAQYISYLSDNPYTFIALNFTPLTKGPNRHLRFDFARFWNVYWNGFTARQEELLRQIEDNRDLAVLRDKEWPTLWEVLKNLAAKNLSELDEEPAYKRLDFIRNTTQSERDAIMARTMTLDENDNLVGSFSPSQCIPNEIFAGIEE